MASELFNKKFKLSLSTISEGLDDFHFTLSKSAMMGMFEKLKDHCVGGRACLIRQGKVIVIGPTTQVPRHVIKRVNIDLLPMRISGIPISESAASLRGHISGHALIQQCKHTYWSEFLWIFHNKNAIIPVVLKKRKITKID
ncbi:hypothetical protein DSO57_1015831 [Entomophthora muscae]|uniref:Uncharacterized protein n=1 Tax=Entomophthora muscae TaxID=34485 RepID=A0ACC2TG54_9FUNG|nr:hypothetical protein DSO57_1015831 [Entomophthora muscae]